MSISGIDHYGNSELPPQSDDAFFQSVQTSRARVNYDIMLKRIRRGAEVGAVDLIVGGTLASSSGLQNYDSRANIYKGDLLMLDRDADETHLTAGGMSYDGRPYVMSSNLGQVLPSWVQTDADFRRYNRVVGMAPNDTTLENAANGAVVTYGTALLTGGAMASTPHVVPEPIYAGDMLWADVGPRWDSDRDQWSKDFKHNRTNYVRGCQKPVLRPWNPYGGADSLIAAVEDYMASTRPAQENEQLAAPSKVGLSAEQVDGSASTGAKLARGTMGIVFQALAILEKANYIVINNAPPKVDEAAAKNLFAFTSSQDRELLAERLGLSGSGQDSLLLSNLFGAIWQSYTNEQALADELDMSKALDSNTLASTLQAESAAHIVTAATGAYYENAANIIAKATHNSQPGDSLRVVVV